VNVLLVAAANSTTGGAERHVADLLRGLPSRGVQPSLLCPAGGDLSELAAGLGVPLYHADIAQGVSVGKFKQVRTAIADADPDIVHGHGSRAAMFARAADPRAAERVVYTVHGIHIDKSGSALRQAAFKTLERTQRPRTAWFVTVCESDVAKGAALGVLDPDRTVTVYNGIQASGPRERSGAFRAELGIARNAPLALSVGRMHEQKDQRTLLAAWSELRDRVPEAVLALLGSGPLEGALREYAAGLRLGESLRFVTPRQDVGAAYADADVFVLSSRWEGLPYVVLEAMDAGVPVVSTDVDGIPEAVEDGVTGLLVPPQDAGALAEAIAAVLADPLRARQMGSAGTLRVAERFGLEGMVDGIVSVYAQVVS